MEEYRELNTYASSPASGKNVRQAEIIEGIIREGQICILCGYFGAGKSPLVQDMAIHVHNGLTWLGRQVGIRDVQLLDFESSLPEYLRNIGLLQERYDCLNYEGPHAHLLQASAPSPGINPLRGIPQMKWWQRRNFIHSLLEKSPDALVIIDPVEHFFHFDRNRASHVLNLFLQLRECLVAFPHAAMILVMNLKRKHHRKNPPSLHQDPNAWLEDAAGNLDLMNRSDVRLGFDFDDDPELRVINGVRRGETMRPIIVRQVGTPDRWCGFAHVECTPSSLALTLTVRQQVYWKRLPAEFRFEEIVARRIVPRSSLSRLVRVARSLGLLDSAEGVHRKI